MPIVQDHKNALLMRVPGERLSEQTMASLQHAIARGLEIVFQLEEVSLCHRARRCCRKSRRRSDQRRQPRR
jgi:hypothetical protein